MIKAYFFDFDGTLSDTGPDIRLGWLSAIRQLGLPEDNFNNVFRVGPPIQETAAMLFPDLSPAELKNLLETYKHFYDDAPSYSALPYPGITNMLEKLNKDGKQIYIVTNKRYKPLWRLMEKFDFFRYCHGIYSPDLLDKNNHIKKPDLLALAVKISGTTADQALMVGDTELDIFAGKANDVLTCAVTWGYGSEELLCSAKPDFIIDDPAQLP